MKPGVIKIRTNKDVCQGCRSCEAVCSLVHTDAVSPVTVGIRIAEQNQLGKFKITVCQQCFDMPCAEACPVSIIARNAYSGAVEIGEGCTGCGACASACPFGAIMMADLEGDVKPYKCDLCGGLPQCVPACPRQALSW
ncbi:MAG: 4Fe-4S dicluster domain-containing protein [Sedimentibacter sp.]|uniref:4Fe-4S dicluster domain-containing protein n=1 Tax=Sedimentibacter sp. TaxID=1960295 RepID=UPI0031598C12